MVFSYYISFIPYTALWYLQKLFKRKLPTVFYCRDLIDWYLFQPVRKYLPEVDVVSDKKETINKLRHLGVTVKPFPFFPQAVIMCRHSTHKFPCSKIVKIGMRHGAYHFKRLTKAENYNAFNLYLFSSEADLKAAQEIGVTVGKAVGFPKLDPAFDDTYDETYLNNLRSQLSLDNEKATILFTATWNKSYMSAVKQWYKRIGELVKFYNVLVTLHPWTEKKFVNRIKETEGIFYIEDDNILPYIMLSDVCIGDTSSIIAECCALNKPIITFRIPTAERTVIETERIIDNISHRINCFPQVILAIEYSLKNRSELAEKRANANKIFFDELDGYAGKRAAVEIINLTGT